jgi:hypothetical protein
MGTTKPLWFVPPCRTYALSKLPQPTLLSTTVPPPPIEKPSPVFVPIDTATALARVQAGNVSVPSKNRRLGRQFWYKYY